MEQDLSFSYSSKPRPVQTSRGKARDVANKSIPINIMHDPRIMRGSVLAPINTSKSSASGEKLKKRRGTAMKKKSSNNRNEPSTLQAKALPSYGFTAISLDANLIEQTQRISEQESHSQTDEFLPRKLNASNAMTNNFFIRPNIGVDTSTQIEERDGLFNFDVEVEPLLDVLVNKTLAQALVEVKEKHEIQLLYHRHKTSEAEKRAAKQSERELEEKAKEVRRQKELVKMEKVEMQRCDQVMREKVLAWRLARPMVHETIDQATIVLQKKGVFYDPMLRDLGKWLAGEVIKDVNEIIRLRVLSVELLDDLICQGLRRQALFTQLLPNQSEALVRLRLRDPLVLTLSEGNDPLCVSVVGPITLSRSDSLETIESKIQTWIVEQVGSPVEIPNGGFVSLLQLANTP